MANWKEFWTADLGAAVLWDGIKKVFGPILRSATSLLMEGGVKVANGYIEQKISEARAEVVGFYARCTNKKIMENLKRREFLRLNAKPIPYDTSRQYAHSSESVMWTSLSEIWKGHGNTPAERRTRPVMMERIMLLDDEGFDTVIEGVNNDWVLQHAKGMYAFAKRLFGARKGSATATAVVPTSTSAGRNWHDVWAKITQNLGETDFSTATELNQLRFKLRNAGWLRPKKERV
jgi:hypothetical protein